MWLINCHTHTLEEVVNYQYAKYAVLSHTWEDGEEVQHQEFRNGGMTQKRGWQKIMKVCQLALEGGYDFAWIDTCCIDKTSSAELSEAINSMFPWYAGAEVCYTYLTDYDASDTNADLSASRWFTRGWTLQELVAPEKVHFYDKSWRSIGTKESLSQHISQITGIGQEFLLASKDRWRLRDILHEVPIARRMSWAANRETTRTEDLAYCLLGIFGINLPLLYGEGMRAFVRLQEEVIKNSNDLSIFAWLSPDNPEHQYCGVFAEHPFFFKASGKTSLIDDVKYIPDFTMTNKGLKMQIALSFDHLEKLHALEINCSNDDTEAPLVIYLKHQGASVFARAKPHQFASKRSIDLGIENKSIFLTTTMTYSAATSLRGIQRRSFDVPVKHDMEAWYFVAAEPAALWDSADHMFITAGLHGFVGCHEYKVRLKRGRGHVEGYFVLFGYGYGFAPWIRVAASNADLHLDIHCGNWRSIAQHMNKKESTQLTVLSGAHGKRSWTSQIQVRLEHATRDGEPIYLVKISSEQAWSVGRT